MNKSDLEALPQNELIEMAKDLAINVKGKNARSLIPLVLKALGEADSADEGEGLPETAAAEDVAAEPTAEEIIAGEKDLLDENDDETNASFDEMSEEEVLEHQLDAAVSAKSHPAVVAALQNALDKHREGNDSALQPSTQTVHTAAQSVAPNARPPKAGSHWPKDKQEVRELLVNQSKRGMTIEDAKVKGKVLSHMLVLKHGHREMAVSLKQPVRTILQQANLLLRHTGQPTEDLSYEEILSQKVAQKAKR